MKKSLFALLCCLALPFFFSSCKLVPFLRYYTVVRKGKYPHFNRTDRFTGSINSYRSCYDVNFYKLDIRPDISQQRLSGDVEISYTNLSDYNSLLLDLYHTMKVKSIVCNGTTVDYRHRRNALFINFKETQKKGDHLTLKIVYEGRPVHFLGHCAVNWKKDSLNKPWVNTLCQGIGADMLWPCKDLLYDEADSLSMRIHVPKGLMGLSNGHFVSKTEGANEDVYEWKCRNTINIYNISFAIGDYKELVFPYTDARGATHDLKAYVLPYHEARGREHFRQLTSIMAFLEKLYGPYPWYNDGYKIFESPHGGAMEHQSAIALGNTWVDNQWGFDDLIVHETAHEWWGNSMTAKDYDDIWLHEGMANYSENLYLEHVKGEKLYQNVMAYYMDTKNKAAKNEVPLIKLPNVRYSAWIAPRDEDIYMKGAIVMHSLRSVIANDSLFFGMLRSFYEQHQKQNITTVQFMQHVKDATGKDLDWFFRQYLYDYRVPELNYFLTKENDKVVFHYKWEQVVSGFILPVKIVNKAGGFEIHPTEQWQQITIEDKDDFGIDRSKTYFNVKKVKG